MLVSKRQVSIQNKSFIKPLIIMRLLLTFILFYSLPVLLAAQSIYTKAYGSPKNQAVIFLHGGPGYSSAAFEGTSAEALAKSGFYVIVYDRRGEGRSADAQAAFTFEETFADLNQIYKKFKLKKAILIGHSFGGIVATLYGEQYPKKVDALVLVGAPLNLQETFTHIINRSTQIYEEKEDKTNLHYINMLQTMDKKSMEYASYCFSHAMQNGFYSAKNPSKEALEIYGLFRTEPLLIEHGSKMTYKAPQGFWKNEHYTSLNLNNNLQTVLEQKTPVFGLYGKEDGLFSAAQVANLEQVIGTDQLLYFENCSHNVFIDQQSAFILALKNWTAAHE
jgi:proline iminopeptidase